MAARRIILATDEIYHIFNRSIANEEIFHYKRRLNRILELIDYYRFPQNIRYSKFKNLPDVQKEEYLKMTGEGTPLVEIYTYALMPNHYHFLLKQLQDKGILRFISNLQNSFAKYYNLKNNRPGSLFQKSFYFPAFLFQR